MKPDTPIPPPPPGLDLGDLNALQVGSEVVMVRPTDKGLEVGSRVYLIHKLESGRVLVRHPDRAISAGGWQTKNHGGTRGMYGPVFYYSANPEHIAQAKERNAAIEAEQVRQQAGRNVLLALARPIGLELGDGERCDSYGEPYDCDDAAQMLADKLTADQLKTLAGWLGVST